MLKSLLRNCSLHAAFAALAFFLLSWRIRWSLKPIEAFEFKESQLTFDESATSSRIPRIIHQSYKTSSLPTVWADTPSRWKKANPDFEYMFWSDEDNRNLIATDYPWFLETYDSYPFPIQRADSARYFAVLKHGGIYADLDIMPTKDISPLLDWLSSKEHQDKEMLVAQTHNLGLTNALFAAVPNSKVLNEFVHILPDNTHPLFGFESLLPHFGILLSTGPTRFWFFLNTYRDKVVTLAPSGWGQCHPCRQGQRRFGGGEPGQCEVQPTAYFETTTGGSWHRWDTKIFNFIFCFPQFFIWMVCGALVVVGRWIATTGCANCGNSDRQDKLPLVNRETRKSMMDVKKSRRSSGDWLGRFYINLTVYSRVLPTLVGHMTEQREVVLYFVVLLVLLRIT